MMAVFAVVRVNPLEVQLGPGNLAVASALLIGGIATALQRSYSFVIGMVAAAVTATTGALASAHVRGVHLPGFPGLWIVIGVYIAFRLTINLQHAQRPGKRRSPGGIPDVHDEKAGSDQDADHDGPPAP